MGGEKQDLSTEGDTKVALDRLSTYMASERVYSADTSKITVLMRWIEIAVCNMP